MSYYILVTVLPVFAVSELQADEQEVGIIVGIFMFGSLLSRLFVGRLCDCCEKKRLLFFLTVCFLISTLLYFSASSVEALIVIRLLHGLVFGAFNTTIFACVAALVPHKHLGEGIGYFSLFMTMGMILGPMTGLWLSKISFLWMFAGCTFFAVLCMGMNALLQLPEEDLHAKHFSWRLKDFLEPKAVPLGIIGGISSFCYSSIVAFIALYAKGMSMLDAVPFYFMASAAAAVVTRPAIGKAFDRLGAARVIYPCILVFCAGLILMANISGVAGLILSGVIIGIGNSSLFSCYQSLVARMAPKGRTGISSSTYFFIFDFCAGAGCMCMGQIISVLGFSATYLTMSGLMLLSMPVYYVLVQRRAV